MKFCTLMLCLLLPLAAQAATPATLRLRPADENVPVQPLGALADAGTIALLYRPDCAPCRRELAALPHLARAHPNNPILLIDLSDDESLAQVPLPAGVHAMRAADSEVAVMDALGDKTHALPYSVRIGANHTVCGGHVGLLGSHGKNPWEASC